MRSPFFSLLLRPPLPASLSRLTVPFTGRIEWHRTTTRRPNLRSVRLISPRRVNVFFLLLFFTPNSIHFRPDSGLDFEPIQPIMNRFRNGLNDGRFEVEMDNLSTINWSIQLELLADPSCVAPATRFIDIRYFSVSLSLSLSLPKFHWSRVFFLCNGRRFQESGVGRICRPAPGEYERIT